MIESMNDPYYIDLDAVALDDFFLTLRKGNISPGRMVLTEKQDERKAMLRRHDIHSLGDLVSVLKTSRKVENFAAESGEDKKYLIILRRQALSWLPNPVALGRFPSVDSDVVETLASFGIKNGKQLFDRVVAEGGWEQLAAETGLDPAPLERLTRFVDLTRIDGIGPQFAWFFVVAGLPSVRAVAAADPSAMVDQVNEGARSVGYTGHSVNLWEMEHCAEVAGKLESPGGLPT